MLYSKVYVVLKNKIGYHEIQKPKEFSEAEFLIVVACILLK